MNEFPRVETTPLPPSAEDGKSRRALKAKIRECLRWELRWIPVEMVMTGLGLLLLVALELQSAGMLVLLIAVATSCVARWLRYTQAGRQRQADRTSDKPVPRAVLSIE